MKILTDKELCRADCPSGYAYKDRGTLVQCEHGALFMVTAEYVPWGSPRHAFMRLSKFWNPVLYRRALATIERETKP